MLGRPREEEEADTLRKAGHGVRIEHCEHLVPLVKPRQSVEVDEEPFGFGKRPIAGDEIDGFPMGLATVQPPREADLLLLFVGGKAIGELGEDGRLRGRVGQHLQLGGLEKVAVGMQGMGGKGLGNANRVEGVFPAHGELLGRKQPEGFDTAGGALFGYRKQDLLTDLRVGFEHKLRRGDQDFFAFQRREILDRSACEIHGGLRVSLKSDEAHFNDRAPRRGLRRELFQRRLGDGSLSMNEGLFGEHEDFLGAGLPFHHETLQDIERGQVADACVEKPDAAEERIIAWCQKHGLPHESHGFLHLARLSNGFALIHELVGTPDLDPSINRRTTQRYQNRKKQDPGHKLKADISHDIPQNMCRLLVEGIVVVVGQCLVIRQGLRRRRFLGPPIFQGRACGRQALAGHFLFRQCAHNLGEGSPASIACSKNRCKAELASTTLSVPQTAASKRRCPRFLVP